MRRLLLLAPGLVALASAHAALYTTNWTASFANSGVVPDNNYSGWVDSRSMTAPAGTISSISVTLDLLGGWNGDLYAYLSHSSGFSVLLDRAGYPDSSYGYGDPGFAVTLTTIGDPIESYQDYSPAYNGNNQLTGTWQAHSGLGSFIGLDPNGTWNLFVADLSAGSVTTVQSWGLQMDIVAVPEVDSWIAAALAGAFGAFWLSRQIWRGAERRRQAP